jgi:hypothetical protein
MAKINNIVTRLRKEISKRDRPYPVELLPELRDAADEIERLRTQLEMWQDGNIMSESHHDEIKRLTAERDEARREVCDMEGETAGGALLEARKRGWDCYEDQPKTASEMLFHELAANNGTKLDIVDRLMLKPPLHSLTNMDLCEAAQLIVRLRKEITTLEENKR